MRPRAPGRAHGTALTLRLRKTDEGLLELCAPAPGLYLYAPARGSRLVAGASAGMLEILGQRHELEVPPAAQGLVVGPPPPESQLPVGFGDPLVVLDPRSAGAAEPAEATASTTTATAGQLVFRAPTSGRFYQRSSPEAAPFIQVGQVLERGQPVGLLEVMKTFNRIEYGGSDLPPEAKVAAIVPEDGSDVEAGDPLVLLEPAPQA